MPQIKRYNPQGRLYFLTAKVGDAETAVTTGTKKVMVKADFDRMNAAWYQWTQLGKHAQNAFSFLTSEEREFLISGTTPAEWKELFGGPDKD